jgi:fatty acid desaturase
MLNKPRADKWLLIAEVFHVIFIVSLAFCISEHHWKLLIFYILSVALLANWSANVIGHIHLHCPLFIDIKLNRILDIIISSLNSYPQSVWKHRHLRHHASGRTVKHFSNWRSLISEVTAILGFWIALLLISPWALGAYVLGILLGLGICAVQGYYEHHLGSRLISAGISHYGPLYNLLYFNDGLHVEHHRSAQHHWSELSPGLYGNVQQSYLPPQLRWAEGLFRRSV